MAMKLIIGLGNPGEEYSKNRHNVGFMWVDYAAQTWDLQPQFTYDKKSDSLVCEISNKDFDRIILVKPQTFMNASGESVRKIMDYYKIKADNIVVVHDDLDIHFGEYKMQKGVGPKVHNGINSIEQTIGTFDFTRIRIGIDNRNSAEFRAKGKSYVLDNFTSDEMNQLLSGVFPAVFKQLGEFYGQR